LNAHDNEMNDLECKTVPKQRISTHHSLERRMPSSPPSAAAWLPLRSVMGRQLLMNRVHACVLSCVLRVSRQGACGFAEHRTIKLFPFSVDPKKQVAWTDPLSIVTTQISMSTKSEQLCFEQCSVHIIRTSRVDDQCSVEFFPSTMKHIGKRISSSSVHCSRL
jgi:hypothetical protein